jgi:nucleoid DNA-binding protein
VKKHDKPNPNDDQRAPSPGITKQIRSLLREVYAAPCDIEELKDRCGYDDEQLLEALMRYRQSGNGVAHDAPIGLLARALCSPMAPVDGAPRNRNPDAGPARQAPRKAKSGFKVAAINELVAKGLGRREATRVVNAIVDAMKDAVKRGEVVETPFGTLKRTLVRRRPRLGRPGFSGKLKWMNPKPHWRMVFRPFPEYRE